MRKVTISYLKGLSNKKIEIIFNIYAPNTGAANYINQWITKSKKHINNNAIVVGDFNTPITEMDRSSKQKINKEIKSLNDTLDQMDISDIFKTFYPKTQNTHSSLVRMEHSPE